MLKIFLIRFTLGDSRFCFEGGWIKQLAHRSIPNLDVYVTSTSLDKSTCKFSEELGFIDSFSLQNAGTSIDFCMNNNLLMFRMSEF